MVRMRMIKPDNVLAPLTTFPLNANQFTGINVIAVLRRIRTRVTTASDRTHSTKIPVHLTEQHSAAFVRISLFAMTANLFKLSLADFQHKAWTTETQSLREIFLLSFVFLCDSVSLW